MKVRDYITMEDCDELAAYAESLFGEEPTQATTDYLMQELQLLTYKYLYYVKDDSPCSDRLYDTMEKEFFKLGETIGITDQSYWIGFDEKHPLAKTAKRIAEEWLVWK